MGRSDPAAANVRSLDGSCESPVPGALPAGVCRHLTYNGTRATASQAVCNRVERLFFLPFPGTPTTASGARWRR
eukprot:13373268-Alexandrium_andersonii.AAC.1